MAFNKHDMFRWKNLNCMHMMADTIIYRLYESITYDTFDKCRRVLATVIAWFPFLLKIRWPIESVSHVLNAFSKFGNATMVDTVSMYLVSTSILDFDVIYIHLSSLYQYSFYKFPNFALPTPFSFQFKKKIKKRIYIGFLVWVS